MKNKLIGIKKFSWKDVWRLVIFSVLILISSIPINYTSSFGRTVQLFYPDSLTTSSCKYIFSGFPLIFYRLYEGCLNHENGSTYNFYTLAFNVIFWYIVSWFLVLLGYKIKERKDKSKK